MKYNILINQEPYYNTAPLSKRLKGDYKMMRQSARSSLVSQYNKSAVTHYMHPEKGVDNENNFQNLLAFYTKEIMEEVNNNTSKDKSVWYANDYIGKNTQDVQFFTNTKYFQDNISLARFGIFMSKTDIKPNEALNAFLQGPTIADCGSLLMACQYKALEKIIGTEKFNDVFGKHNIMHFIITNNLYLESGKEVFLDGKPMHHNSYNPLHSMYKAFQSDDSINIQITEGFIQTGDVLHVKGISTYLEKHPTGESLGYNLVCVGKNENSEKIYTAFGKRFIKPLTLNEIKQYMLDMYNKDQSQDDIEYIQSKNLSNNLESHKIKYIDEDGSLGKIEAVLKPSLEKMVNFTSIKKRTMNSWYNKELNKSDLDKLNQAVPQKDNLLKISNTQTENVNNSFKKYHLENDKQKHIKEMSQKFASSIINDESKTRILVISGEPGIGKTHLANSVANAVASRKKVAYINPEILLKIIQDTKNDIDNEHISKWFSDVDLIVFDDVNVDKNLANEAGRFLKKLLLYCVKSDKSILLTSNVNIDIKSIVSEFDIAVSPDNKINDNILVLNELDLKSKRSSWMDNNIGVNHNQITTLAEYDGKKPAGIFVTTKEEINKDYLQNIAKSLRNENNNLKIRISDTPTKSELRTNEMGQQITATGIVNDLFVKKGDHDQYDTFIIKVTNNDECKQFLHLISHVNDTSSKVVVVCKNVKHFNELINNEFSSFHTSFKDDEKKLRDRIRVIMPNDKETRKIKQAKGDDDIPSEEVESLNNSVIKIESLQIQQSDSGKPTIKAPNNAINKPTLLQRLLSLYFLS